MQPSPLLTLGLTALLLTVSGTARAADQFAGKAYYYGDPHAHTGLSHDGWSSDLGDGCPPEGECGAFADAFQIATDNGLDWVVLSDHVNGMYATTPAEFATLLDTAVNASGLSDLLVIPGVEDWFASGGVEIGHKNLLLFGAPEVLADLDLSDVQPNGDSTVEVGACPAIPAWMDGLTAAFGPALLIPHHPMVENPMPTDWSCNAGAYEPAVEMFSSWGTGLGWDRDFDTPSTLVESGAVDVAMDPDGYDLHLGFLAGTDGHSTLPGDLCKPVGGGRVNTGGLTMAVIAEGTPFDRTALYDAIRLHRTIATSGPRIPLSVFASDTHGDTWSLGQDIALPAGDSLTIGVQVPESDAHVITGVWLVTPDGDLPLSPTAADTWSRNLADDALPAWGYLAVQIDGSALDLCDDADDTDEEWEWASPSWMRRVDHDWDADGLSFDDGDCDDADPTVTTCAQRRTCGCAASPTQAWQPQLGALALISWTLVHRRRRITGERR